ncbi:MAG: insulinase family protein, partial [bacterium]|nr:insulinase family protein [bacterium]
MKVGKINPVLFRSSNTVTKPEKQKTEQKNISGELAVTPDFAVSVPAKYTKISQDKLPNGLEVHSYKLANGYRVTVVPMEGSPAVVKNYVNVGSMNETDDIKGISHFLEHMAFNGTTGEDGYIKLETGDSFKRIDALGGWTNASTSYAVTDYVNSTPVLEEKDLEEQIKIIAAMTENLALTDKMIEKEKGPVCSEINMIMDDPMTIALDQTLRSVFNIKSSADEMVAGSIEHIKNLTRGDVKKYYDKYYTPQNMNLVVTGDVSPDEVIELVAKNFKSTKVRSGMPYEEQLRPTQESVRKDFISNKANQTEIVLGFAGPKNNDIKSDIISDILSDYLASTSVGINKELTKFNASPEYFKEKISTNPNNPSLLYYAFNTSEENSEVALKIVYDKLNNLKAPTEKELKNMISHYMQQYNEIMEYSDVVNSVIGYSILDGNFNNEFERERILNSITTEDVQEYIDKYLDISKAALTVVHPDTCSENVLSNYNNASELTFKGGTNRLPLNTA